MPRKSSIAFGDLGSTPPEGSKMGITLPPQLQTSPNKTSSPIKDLPESPTISQRPCLRNTVSHSELRSVNPIFSAATLPASSPPDTDHQDFLCALKLVAAGHYLAGLLEKHLPSVTETELMSYLAAFGAKSQRPQDAHQPIPIHGHRRPHR